MVLHHLYLWDYFGFVPGIVPTATSSPIDFPKRAYNLVWNEYYRDETLQTEKVIETSEDVLIRNWEKDYFTASLPWQQRGTAPALPISGTTKAIWPGVDATHTPFTLQGDMATGPIVYKPRFGDTKGLLEANTIDLSTASTFNISDLRLAFQIQRWMERNARAGARYTESLQAHFGVSPRDERLQRPEYIGGSKSPVIISEVLQTSSSDATSPQGNMADLS